MGCKKTGIPNVLTYSNQFDINSALSFRKDPLGQILPLCSSNSHYSIYKLMQENTQRSNHKEYFFQNIFVLMSAKRTGILSKNSWWVGNGLVDKVIVDNINQNLNILIIM